MEYTSLEYWIWLTMAFGPANARKWSFLSRYKSIAEAYNAVSHGELGFVLPEDIQGVKSADMNKARKMVQFCETKKIGIVCYDDEDYPTRLKEIYNPPSVLFYKGDISGIDDSIVIAAVGTRNPSDYSVKIGKRICGDLAKKGVVIASGFAVGLDSVAHSSAMKAGGRTIAVLPCGLLHDYPPENAGAKETVSRHGAVISEYFPGDKTTPLLFRARNRILSGISLGALVLQTSSHGGALSTASFALSQGRDIFCIPPHELYNDDYAGASALIRDGAIPVFDADDVICAYTGIYPNKLLHQDALQRASDHEDLNPEIKKAAPAVRKKPVTAKKSAEAAAELQKPDNTQQFADLLTLSEGLSGTKKLIYEYLRDNGETHLDQLAVGIADVYELEAFLTELELEGLIRSLPGNRFTI